MKALLQITLCLLLFCPIFHYAQESKGKIEGHVTDSSTGELVIGASVYLNKDTTKTTSSYMASTPVLIEFDFPR